MQLTSMLAKSNEIVLVRMGILLQLLYGLWGLIEKNAPKISKS